MKWKVSHIGFDLWVNGIFENFQRNADVPTGAYILFKSKAEFKAFEFRVVNFQGNFLVEIYVLIRNLTTIIMKMMNGMEYATHFLKEIKPKLQCINWNAFAPNFAEQNWKCRQISLKWILNVCSYQMCNMCELAHTLHSQWISQLLYVINEFKLFSHHNCLIKSIYEKPSKWMTWF